MKYSFNKKTWVSDRANDEASKPNVTYSHPPSVERFLDALASHAFKLSDSQSVSE